MTWRRSGVTTAYGGRRRKSGVGAQTAPTGALVAAAALSGTSTVSQAGTGTLVADAELTGVSLVSQAGTGSLAASAALSGSSSVSQSGTGSLAASAALSGTGTAGGQPPVSGYLAWYDASQITGQSDGSSLSAWSDLSSNGYNMSQSTGADQPTYYSSTAGKLINGLPAVWFNGTSDRMTNSTSVSLANCSIFAVVQLTSDTNNATILGSSASGGLQLRTNTGARLNLLAEGTTDIGADSSGEITPGSNNAGAATYDSTTGAYAFYVNSGTATTTGTNATTISSHAMVLGFNGSNTSEFWDGAIAEVIVYNSVLTGAQITSTFTYLNNKWGT